MFYMGYRTVNINLPVNSVIQGDDVGCAVASSAMVVNYLTGANLTYEQAETANGGTSMNWSGFASNYGLSYQRVPTSGDSSFASLKVQLFRLLYDENIPVVVRVYGTKGQHYVVVKGIYGTFPEIIDDNGNVSVNVSSATASMFKVVDPWPSWNATNLTLQDVMDDKGTGDLKALYVYRG